VARPAVPAVLKKRKRNELGRDIEGELPASEAMTFFPVRSPAPANLERAPLHLRGD